MANAAVSPLARAIRLGAEIRLLREDAGISQADLARRVGIARTVLSRIESPAGEPHRRADPRTVRDVLTALAAGRALRRLEPLIWDACAHGWWDTHRGMGAGQQIVAGVECGAAVIRAYQVALIPGLAQTREYARSRAVAAGDPDPAAVVEGRMRRQQQIATAGTRLDIVVEDLALRRLVAPPDVMAGQLRHLVALAERPDVSVRVLPPDALLDEGWAPTSPFSVYSYPDPADPTIVLLDVVGQLPAPLAEPDATRLYVQLHERLAGAALSDVDSAALIKSAADQMAGR